MLLLQVIDRATFDMTERRLTEHEILEATREGVQTVAAFGCVGFLKLLAGLLLFLVASC